RTASRARPAAGLGDLFERQPARPRRDRRHGAGDRPQPRRCDAMAGAHRRGHPRRGRRRRPRGLYLAQFGDRNPVAGAHLVTRRIGAALLFVAAFAATQGVAMPIQRVTAASGVEAWLVEDHTIPVVTLAFAFAGGAALDPPGREGTATMAAGLLDEGAGPYDSTAFHRRLDQLAGELRLAAGHDEFGGSLRMLRRNLEPTAD